MILRQFEEAVWHWRGSDCDVTEPWHHSGEIVSAVEAVFEFGKVAGYMLVADGAVSASDGALDVAEGALLLKGEFGAGWQEYEWRWKGGVKGMEPQKFAQPLWQGEDLAGKTLLLTVEQGFGDTL
jgi:hypothetical protein